MRPVPLLLGGAVVLVSLVVAVLFYRAFGAGSGVQYGVRSYVTSSQQSVRITFEVSMEPGRTATCTVRARDRDGAETGSAQVRVGPARGRSTVTTYDLATRARAVSGEVTACTLAPTG